MHVDVSQIINQEEGSSVDFTIDDEQPDLEDAVLAKPLSGQIRIMKTEDGIMVGGTMQASIILECHRCLRTFNQDVTFPLRAVFSQYPGEDEFSISSQAVIDLNEPVRQDLIVHLPHRHICGDDCPGTPLIKEKYGSS
jgi:uncharacterized protein